MTLTVINAEQLRTLLPMGECIDVMEPAMIAASLGSISMPPRSMAPIINDHGLQALMPGSSAELGKFGSKILSIVPANAGKGLPVIQGFVALFDFETGEPLAIIEGAEITAIRTAAASGLATRLLAREDARSCGIFGTGVQALSHIDAICAVRPIEEIIIWGRNADKARELAKSQASRSGLKVIATEDAALAGACDVLCTVTASEEPVLRGEWVQAGAHLNLVGAHSLQSREVDSTLVKKSRIYTDLMESLRQEGGDIMIPLAEGAIAEDQIMGEIGNLCAGKIEGRTDDKQITLYKSHGINAQDMYAAAHVYEQARKTGTGTVVDF